MNADAPRSPTKHQFDHALPVVIHHPEEELPLLARWVHRAMANKVRFYGLIGALVVVLLGLSVLTSGLTLGRAKSDEAWTKLEVAKTPTERVEIAKDFPKTPAERWALLQAATEYYNQGFNDLPGNREVALPSLKKALELFEKVAAEAEPDSAQARLAALGAGRTLEARNELDKAVAQYEKVARTKAWAGTEEARTAERLAKTLKAPGSAAFYKELYAYKPVQADLPPGGSQDLTIPFPGHPPIGSPSPLTTPPVGPITLPDPFPRGSGTTPEPNPLIVPPPPPSPAPKANTPAPASAGLPADVFGPAAPRPETKAETPK